MQCDIGMGFDQRRPFALRFLHPVFAEHALSLPDQGHDTIGGMSLADRDQRDFSRFAAGKLRGPGDTPADLFQRGGCTFHGGAL